LLGSVATFVVMMIVFRGAFWVWFMLFWVANSVRDLVQAALLKNQIKNPVAFQAALEAFKDAKHKKKRRRRRGREAIEAPQPAVQFPPPAASGDYVPPARTTGELKKPDEFVFDPDNPPPSVTEGTTRLLEEERPAEDERYVQDERYVPPSAARNPE
jgi:hypothetical protein